MDFNGFTFFPSSQRRIIAHLSKLRLSGVILALFLTLSCEKPSKPALVSVSPDETKTVSLFELDRFDQNFELQLKTTTTETIFKSPDEGRPVGTEKIVWSDSSRYFLLIGKHFHLSSDWVNAKLPSGEMLYLLYDTQTRELWCNAEQHQGPRFSLADLLAKDKWPQDPLNTPSTTPSLK